MFESSLHDTVNEQYHIGGSYSAESTSNLEGAWQEAVAVV